MRAKLDKILQEKYNFNIGNLLTYDGYTYTWQKGRQLAGISGNGTSLSFKYNSSGLRTQKVSGSTTTDYIYKTDKGTGV
jgi:hypothetical protein